MTNTANVCINLKEEIERLSKLLERLETLQVAIEEINKDLAEEGLAGLSYTELQDRMYLLEKRLTARLVSAYKAGCIDWVVQDEKV